jgi:aryl-alcohol dehydrogenase-like predicted oxidoreductase
MWSAGGGCNPRSRYARDLAQRFEKLTKIKKLEERKKQGEKIRTLVAGEEQSELEVKYSEVLSKIADAHQVDSVTVIALAYVLQKAPYVFPIVGKCSP